MRDCLSLLDQALALGASELDSLNAGDVDQASETSRIRKGLIHEALDCGCDIPTDAIRDKLLRLQSLQSRLTDAAKVLHESMRQELSRSRKESTRLAGYGMAAKGVPRFRGLSKRG